MSRKTASYSWRDKVSYSWGDSKWLLLTPVGALLALYGFTTTWISYPASAFGWEMALNVANKDLVLLPGVATGALALLWLVPVTALLLFGWGIARLFWVRLPWARVWLCFLVCLCLVLMSSFCLPLFPPAMLQNLHGKSLDVGFWLTGAALLLSVLCLFIPNPGWWTMAPDQQSASEVPAARVPRRRVLTSMANLGGLLVVGGVVGVDLGWLTRPYVPRHQILSIGKFQFNNPSIRRLVWLPDNASLLECLSGPLRSWNIATGKVTQTYLFPSLPDVNIFDKTDKSFDTIARSPDGRWLAASTRAYGIIIWDAASGQFVRRFDPPMKPSLAIYGGVAWSPDGASLATSKFVSDNQAALFILRASDLKQLVSYPLSIIADALAWSPDGRMLAVTKDGDVEVWDLSQGKQIWMYQPPHFSRTSELYGQIKVNIHVEDVAWAPDSRHLAFSLDAGSDGTSTVQIWDIPANKQVLSCQGHRENTNGLAWSPDGSRIAAAGSDCTVQVWNAQTGAQLLMYQGHLDSVWSVAWSPDGKSLASGSADGTIQIWEAPTL